MCLVVSKLVVTLMQLQRLSEKVAAHPSYLDFSSEVDVVC